MKRVRVPHHGSPARPAHIAQSSGGYTLIELLIVMAILGILATLAGSGLLGYLQRLNLQNDVANSAQTIKYAISEVRRANLDATLTLTDKTLTVRRGTIVLRTATFSRAPALECSPSCTGNTITLQAPFGRTETDYALKFTLNSLERTLLVRGPLGMVSFK